ncbi:MAG: hypothetical protein KDA52_16520 [Planctomycetaceae bacterium]|nr:hypothetical protein [Planctomycetaceae bacterium]
MSSASWRFNKTASIACNASKPLTGSEMQRGRLGSRGVDADQVVGVRLAVGILDRYIPVPVFRQCRSHSL